MAIHEIKLYGRGGQGILTAGELLARASILKGLYAQSIPAFGPERRGGPSICSLRISEEPILLRCGVMNPKVVCIFDPSIWHFINVLAGFQEGGTLIFNSRRDPRDIEKELKRGKHGYSLSANDYKLFAVDATEIAVKNLGKPITNTAMMGAFSRATGLVDMYSIEEVMSREFPEAFTENMKAAKEGYASLRKI